MDAAAMIMSFSNNLQFAMWVIAEHLYLSLSLLFSTDTNADSGRFLLSSSFPLSFFFFFSSLLLLLAHSYPLRTNKQKKVISSSHLPPAAAFA
jgi:hypothetical protein